MAEPARDVDVRRERPEVEVGGVALAAGRHHDLDAGPGEPLRRGAEDERVAVVERRLGRMAPGAVGGQGVEPRPRLGVGGRLPDAGPDVVDGGRQVAAVVVELSEAPDEIEREARRELVEGAAHRRQVVLGAKAVDALPQPPAEELRRPRDRALRSALAAVPRRGEPEAPRGRAGAGDQRAH
jgi:hypothetical protein